MAKGQKRETRGILHPQDQTTSIWTRGQLHFWTTLASGMTMHLCPLYAKDVRLQVRFLSPGWRTLSSSCLLCLVLTLHETCKVFGNSPLDISLRVSELCPWEESGSVNKHVGLIFPAGELWAVVFTSCARSYETCPLTHWSAILFFFYRLLKTKFCK